MNDLAVNGDGRLPGHMRDFFGFVHGLICHFEQIAGAPIDEKRRFHIRQGPLLAHNAQNASLHMQQNPAYAYCEFFFFWYSSNRIY